MWTVWSSICQLCQHIDLKICQRSFGTTHKSTRNPGAASEILPAAEKTVRMWAYLLNRQTIIIDYF